MKQRDRRFIPAVRSAGFDNHNHFYPSLHHWWNDYRLSVLPCGLCFVFLFGKLAAELLKNELLYFDQLIISYISLLNGPVMTELMKGITVMGSATVLIFLALLTVIYLSRALHRYDESNMVIVALAGSWLANEFLKWLFQRSRPDEMFRLVEVSGYSFPSGHAMVSFAFYGLLLYLLWVNLQTKKRKYFWAAVLGLLVLAIGLSRIYLGVHYPSDVLAGFAAGGVWLVGCILGLQAAESSRRPRF
ncbi:MAG TPA: phosphatase PAP2 family protein [Peptococcaceae bacterium]|nr:phosphatase PAP2 family protein [Clostridia bacterium]HOB82574.1 phosphatase PAP2 family protein [Peptococcaceae bacterium]HPZ71772.1 phosphatase PAP2 family protein [Peptococcaceae bacterium]HQD54667.1 phosphatase PAP2 family protein [Peptococcaceae bacterium]